MRDRHYLEFLDVFRGVAILAVFVFHSYDAVFGSKEGLWGWHAVFLPARFGWGGVAIFFVVSGFCIHLAYCRDPRWSVFYNRRFFRIYPPYLLALLIFAFVFPLTRLTSPTLFNAAQLGSHVLLVHNLSDRSLYGINPSFWSMAAEMQLYLLYPLVLRLVSKFGWKVALCVALGIEIAICESALFFEVPDWLERSPFRYWGSWTLGAAVAHSYLHGVKIVLPRGTFLFLGSLLGLSLFIRAVEVLGFLVIALLTAAAMVANLSRAQESAPSSHFVFYRLRQAGLWSYSIYLLHQPLLWLVARFASVSGREEPPGQLMMFVTCVLSWFVIVAIGGACYRLVERPSIHLGKSLLSRAPHRAIPVPAA